MASKNELGTLSAAAGLLAGFSQGSVYLLWKSLTKWRDPTLLRVPGILISHGISHSILFSTYEVMKGSLMWALDAHHLTYTGLSDNTSSN